MSLEPGRAAAIRGPHRVPPGRRRPVPGRPRAIPVAKREGVAGAAIRPGQIPAAVIPAGAAATPAREVRAVTGGIRDVLPGAAAIHPARRPAGCPPSPGQAGLPGRARPGRNRPGRSPSGRNRLGRSLTACAMARGTARPDRALPAAGGILPRRAAWGDGARCRAASGSASSSPARPSAPSSPWWPGVRLASCSDCSSWSAR